MLSVNAHVERVLARRRKNQAVQVQHVGNPNPGTGVRWAGAQLHLSVYAHYLVTSRIAQRDLDFVLPGVVQRRGKAENEHQLRVSRRKRSSPDSIEDSKDAELA